jgi:hypothetical protein
VKGGISVDANANDSRNGETPLLVYINSSHEYVVFDPHKNEELVSSKHKGRKIQAEESGEFIVLSCYIFLSFKLLDILHLSYRSLPARNCLRNILRGVKNCCLFIFLLLQNICEKIMLFFVFFQHQSATLLFMESFQNWSRPNRFQISHLSRQIDLGRLYSVDRLMFFHLSQSYVPHSCHHCWRRGRLQMSEAGWSFAL